MAGGKKPLLLKSAGHWAMDVSMATTPHGMGPKQVLFTRFWKSTSSRNFSTGMRLEFLSSGSRAYARAWRASLRDIRRIERFVNTQKSITSLAQALLDNAQRRMVSSGARL